MSLPRYPLPDTVIADVLQALKFDDKGLIPAIAQQYNSGEILMMAWMNEDAVRETLTTGRVCYWSRSRSALWRKGESSGQIQSLKALRYDCDADTVLLKVDQDGVACHTGRHNCFYFEAQNGGIKTIADVQVSPDKLYLKK